MNGYGQRGKGKQDMERTLYTVLVDNARQSRDQPALIAADRRVTFGQLLQMTDKVGDALRSHGMLPGDPVAMLAMNRLESFVVLGAVAREGLIVFPVNWRLSEGEIAAQLELAQAKALIADSTNLSSIPAGSADPHALRVVMDGPAPEGWVAWDQLTSAESEAGYSPDRADPFLLLSTAAVEGTPRAALLSHGNLMTAAGQLADKLELSADDRHLAALPLFHITGLELSLATLLAGGTNVILDRFDPAAAAEMILEHGVTLLASFPPLLSMLLDAAQAVDVSFDSLRYVLGLDAPEVIQRLLATTDASFWTGYGQSETTGVVTLTDVREQPGSVGRALPEAELRIFNQSGEAVGAGEQGEIVVRGPLVFLGYWHDEDASRYAGRYGWHHTGDLGRLDGEGYLYYLGRKPEKDLIKSGGENIYPAEVEHAIKQLPQVSAVCVIGIPDQRWGEAVKAVVELKTGETLSEDEIISAVADRIASYKKPRQVEFVDRMPRDSEGKVDRQAVRSTFG
jgi:acyl-CoA synthetase (AMP-forming)/AMP-acid ligase II